MSKGPIDTDCMTLTRFILEEQRKHLGASGDFTTIMTAICSAVKALSSAVRKAGVHSLHAGLSPSGSRKLDKLANDLFINMLSSTYKVAGMVSEQNARHISVKLDQQQQAKYIVCFDPLDGYSNIDCLASIGSIFGIFKRRSDSNGEVNETDFCRKGSDLIAAGYAIYGSATMMVITFGNGVHGFTLDTAIGEFVLTNRSLSIPATGKFYSANEGYNRNWCPKVRRFIDQLKEKDYKARYVGSMVADVHRTICYGGIFLYPGSREHPNGKLRLLYECFPMAFLMQQAGGAAVSGVDRHILDMTADSIHHRCPVFMGSAEEVNSLLLQLRE